MAVKVLIKRIVEKNKAMDMIPLLRQIRAIAVCEIGYISGETLRNLDDPEEFFIISTWNSADDWKNWLENENRIAIQNKIDLLLGKETEYKILHYGLTERSTPNN